MKEVETQEPRFVNTLVENNGRYDGVDIYLKLHFAEFSNLVARPLSK